MAYPITIKMSSALLDDFRESELGSYEDYLGDDDPDRYADEHVYEILGRHLDVKKRYSTIEVLNAGEAAEVYYAACSGTFQINQSDYGGNASGTRAACRIADALRPALQAEGDEYADLLRTWPAPSGY